MKPIITTIAFILFSNIISQAQSSKGDTRYFGEPIITDSSSTIMLPTHYNESFFSKGGMGGNYYSNIIFYNFKTDTSKKLFSKDTYIKSLDLNAHNYYNNKTPNYSMVANRIFYRVMNVNRDRDKYIDGDDPTMLYCSDYYGNNLKLLSSTNENVVSLEIFKDQNFLLVKMQRDKNNDGKFNYKDSDYYFIKLDLVNLKFGKKIETNSK